MAIVLKDRVKQTANAPGTGTITLGSTPTGFQAFSAIGNGNVTYFAIVDPTSGAWEVNYGTYTLSGTTLSRNATPLSSSAAGALVNFTGTVDVFCTYPSSKAIYEETSGNVLIDGGPITVVGSGVTAYTTFGAALGELYANVNSFAQLYAQNLNGGSAASTDIVAYNDLGDGTNNFVDMGISSSNYSDATYPIFTAGSGYVYNNGGEMIIGSQTHDLLLFAGGVATTDWALRVNKTSKLITTKGGLALGGALAGIGGSFTSPVTTTSSMTAPGTTEFVTKAYVDNATSSALTFHTAVQVATTQSLAAQTGGTVTYNNGTLGVGATITLSVALTVLDGYTLLNTNRILVKNESNQTYNGIYTWATGGTVLTRATDADTAGSGANLLSLNDYFYVQNGTVNKGVAYVLSAPSTAIVFGTSNIQFAEFSSSQIYTGTSPIDVTGTVISLTTVPATKGGTGTATVTTGDTLYGSGTNTWSKLPIGAAYKSLIVNGAGTLPEWNAVALNQSGAVSGALPATNGGTGLSSYTLGDTIYSSAANTIAALPGNTTTTKKFLVQTGTGAVSAAPAWGTINGSDVTGNISGSAGSVANALTLGTYLTGTSFNGSAAVTTAVDATSTNTASKVVARDVSGNFSANIITAALTGNASTATAATNIAGGAANQVPYQTGAATTSFIAAPTTGSTFLSWSGSAFAWSAISTPSSVTFNNGGTGDASGTTFNGSVARTISYNTVGASPLAGSTSLTTTGTVTTGTWSGLFGAVTGANLTNLTAGNLAGTIPSAVLGNSTVYVGTTAVALNRASANLALTGILSETYAGATSGTVQVIPAAVAGTGTVFTLPATTGTAITTGDTGTVTNTMLAGSIADTKLSTIATALKVSNSATTATNANTASAIVARDASGNFSAGTITATLSGSATSAGTATTATTATNIAGGVAGALPYQSGAGATGFSAAGTSGQVLTSSGTTAPTWTTATSANTASAIVQRDASGNFSAGTITAALSGNASTATSATSATSATTATTATNLAGGAAGTIPYQSAAGTTVQLTAGTAGYILQANGAAAPSWVVASTAAGVNNGTLTMAVAGTGLSGSQTFTANQSSAATFTVTSNATNLNTASTIVARDASGNFTAGTITAALTGNASTATSATTATNLAGGAVGSIAYQSAAGATTFLADVATGNAVISGGVGVAPSYGKIGLTTHVSGTLPVANGGTGVTTSTGTGDNVLSTSPTLVTPILGTPTSGTLTNCTFPTLNQNTTGSAATFTSTTQNSQFNSIGVGTAGSTVAGQIRATDSVVAFYSSDIRFKENVQTIPNAVDTVNAIGGKLFDWTDAYIEKSGGEDGYFVQKSDFGVIAQDVQKAFPRATRTKQDGSLAVDYEKLCALAFAAIGELTKRIEALEAKG